MALFLTILIPDRRLSLTRQVDNPWIAFCTPSAEALEMNFKLSQSNGYCSIRKTAENEGSAESNVRVRRGLRFIRPSGSIRIILKPVL